MQIAEWVISVCFWGSVVWSHSAPQSSDGDGVEAHWTDAGEGEARTDLSEDELRRLVEEEPESDPLNTFHSPHEPYRLKTYAYWQPITDPSKHANPLLPSGFLPPNAPPKSLPDDFFYDEEGRMLALNEHAASMCPWLRRWRELNPLRPYPVGPSFASRHPPIKFVPGRGYEVDYELAQLNAALREAPPPNRARRASHTAPARPGPGRSLQMLQWQLRILVQAMLLVQRRRPEECGHLGDFLLEDKERNGGGDEMASRMCLEEAIFELELVEESKLSAEQRQGVPDLVDKPGFFGPLLRVILAKKMSGKHSKSTPKRPKPAIAAKQREQKKQRKGETGARRRAAPVPLWAQLRAGEQLDITEDDHLHWPEIYQFPYSAVSLPFSQPAKSEQ